MSAKPALAKLPNFSNLTKSQWLMANSLLFNSQFIYRLDILLGVGVVLLQGAGEVVATI